MTAPLTVHNANVTTAAVEVKTLTISGKQVTLAVFRQLITAPLIKDDGALNGIPWGVVNYHPDKCVGLLPHKHIVWQRGETLRRDRIFTVRLARMLAWLDYQEQGYLTPERFGDHKADPVSYRSWFGTHEVPNPEANPGYYEALGVVGPDFLTTCGAIAALPQLFIAV
jgi:hypothetical protein